jgi:hypothetical protein
VEWRPGVGLVLGLKQIPLHRSVRGLAPSNTPAVNVNMIRGSTNGQNPTSRFSSSADHPVASVAIHPRPSFPSIPPSTTPVSLAPYCYTCLDFLTCPDLMSGLV